MEHNKPGSKHRIERFDARDDALNRALRKGCCGAQRSRSKAHRMEHCEALDTRLIELLEMSTKGYSHRIKQKESLLHMIVK